MDSEKAGCVLCGGSPGLRAEPVYVSEDTKTKLLAHADELKAFGMKLETDTEQLKKHYTAEILAGLHLVIDIAEKLYPGTLRKLVRYLKRIGIPREEIPRLRLDEPEKILAYYGGDQSGLQEVRLKRRKGRKSVHTKSKLNLKSKGRRKSTKRRLTRPKTRSQPEDSK